jgi:hypothetical protein
LTALDDMIARLRKLPELAAIAAEDVADVLDEELHATIAAGTAPDGTPWAPTLEGKRPLQNAGRAGTLFVQAVGRVVYVRLTGPEARHHRGIARGRKVRQIIPGAGRLPPRLAAAVQRVIAARFATALGGGKQP